MYTPCNLIDFLFLKFYRDMVYTVFDVELIGVLLTRYGKLRLSKDILEFEIIIRFEFLTDIIPVSVCNNFLLNIRRYTSNISLLQG